MAVQHVPCPALPHGFFQLPLVLDRAAEIVHRTGASLRAALDAAASPQPGGPSPR